MKAPPSAAELAQLAKKMGGPRQLIAPKKVAELASKADAEIIPFLAENPNYVRRPLFDTGSTAFGGFTEDSRAKLEALKRG